MLLFFLTEKKSNTITSASHRIRILFKFQINICPKITTQYLFVAPLPWITAACHGGDRLEALLSYSSSVFLGRGFLVDDGQQTIW